MAKMFIAMAGVVLIVIVVVKTRRASCESVSVMERTTDSLDRKSTTSSVVRITTTISSTVETTTMTTTQGIV